MLHSIQLENFKAFGARAVIPLAPITIIFGQNSAGKSSVLQALNLLKQTRESRDVEALLLPRTENGFVDLGSFQDLLFDHDLSRLLSIRLNVDLDRVNRDNVLMPRFSRRTKTIGLEFCFSRKTLQDEITLEGFKLCGDDPASFIAEFQNSPMPRDFRRYATVPLRSERRRKSGSLRAAKCVQVRDEPDYWRPAHDWTLRERQLLSKKLEEARSTLQSPEPADVRALEDEDDQSEMRAKFLRKIDEYIGFLSKEFSYNEFIEWMVNEQIGSLVALDGFIPVMANPKEGEPTIDVILNRSLGRAPMRRDWSADLGYSSIFAGRVIEQTLGALFPLGPFRKPPSRWYIFTGTTPQDVGYQGHLLPDLLFRQRDLLDNANDWLRQLDIGYEIKIKSLGDLTTDLFELRLVDTRRRNSVEVGLSDVGFGISQLLPLIVQSLATSDQIISIEQPEVHIHPRLQADLGDLLVAAIQHPRRNQFIVETHSEHLALRLQRRVRDGSLSPRDISVVYVSRGPDGAIVQPLRLDKEGDFIDDFPGGFFPERLRELR